ncbi:exocyst complex component 4-like [Sphaerodactylus townsendi]|uniref:exocyst complex component 4-like n=1 Tax=Sphaerodactylus townsendi TaxID=933632 RepID=UPI002026EB43|nr:exocyst complex component 4-like [Sphaerodactylus townsendi]
MRTTFTLGNLFLVLVVVVDSSIKVQLTYSNSGKCSSSCHHSTGIDTVLTKLSRGSHFLTGSASFGSHLVSSILSLCPRCCDGLPNVPPGSRRVGAHGSIGHGWHRHAESSFLVVYSRFIQEVEHALGLSPAKQCPLREFLTMYIKNIFLNQVLGEINKEIEGVTKTTDPLKILANADTMKMLGVQRPLLQSTVIVEKTIQDLMNLMHDLSAYSDQFLNMVCVKLQEYRDTCTLAYRSIVQSDEKLVISASWAKDDDISRLLKSLPNWMNMAQPKQLRPKREEEDDFIRTAFGKESEVLIGNLGDKLIPQQEILRDVSDLKALANMHESLEWLSSRMKAAFSNLPTAQMSPGQNGHANMDLPPVSEQIMQTLTELARSFQEMADRCLLVLHLEVRVHCFHLTHLMPLAKAWDYALLGQVLKLNKGTSSAHQREAMNASLQQHKFQYIFEGLGHLISCILINGAQYFKRISESGIKKMCRNIFILQQNLTNITMSREADLDFARQFYEMLYNTAGTNDLNLSECDQGVKCRPEGTSAALSLLHTPCPGRRGRPSQAGMRLQRLKEIICEQ